MDQARVVDILPIRRLQVLYILGSLPVIQYLLIWSACGESGMAQFLLRISFHEAFLVVGLKA